MVSPDAARPRSGDQLHRLVVLVLGIVVLLPLLMMAFAMPMMGMMGWWWGDGMMGLSPVWGIVMMLGWPLVLVGIGYALYRGFTDIIEPAANPDPALAELRLAYARGDLSDEEFEERRETLRRRE